MCFHFLICLVWISVLLALLTLTPNISFSVDEMYYGPQPNVYNGRYIYCGATQ